jgi:hypothetical protein
MPELKNISAFDQSLVNGNRDRINAAIQYLEHALSNLRSLEHIKLNDVNTCCLENTVDELKRMNIRTLEIITNDESE